MDKLFPFGVDPCSKKEKKKKKKNKQKKKKKCAVSYKRVSEIRL